MDDLLSSNYDWGTVDGTIADALLGSSSDPAVKVSEQWYPTREFLGTPRGSSSVPHEGVPRYPTREFLGTPRGQCDVNTIQITTLIYLF